MKLRKEISSPFLQELARRNTDREKIRELVLLWRWVQLERIGFLNGLVTGYLRSKYRAEYQVFRKERQERIRGSLVLGLVERFRKGKEALKDHWSRIVLSDNEAGQAAQDIFDDEKGDD